MSKNLPFDKIRKPERSNTRSMYARLLQYAFILLFVVLPVVGVSAKGIAEIAKNAVTAVGKAVGLINDPKKPDQIVQVAFQDLPDKNLTLVIKPDYGALRVDIECNSSKYQSVRIVKKDTGGYYYSYRQSLQKVDAAAMMAKVESEQAETDMNKVPAWGPYWNLSGSYYKGKLLGVDLPFSDQIKVDNSDPNAKKNVTSVDFPCFGEQNLEFIVLYENADGSFDYDAFHGTVTVEFFAGEADLFSLSLFKGNVNFKNYQDKALSFLWYVMCRENQGAKQAFETAIKSHFPGIYLEYLAYPSDDTQINDNWKMGNFINNCKRAIATSFRQTLHEVKQKENGISVELPIFDYDWQGLDRLYGSWSEGERNPYIAGYLAFAFEQVNRDGYEKSAKPVLSTIIQDSLAKVGVNYDFRMYQPVSVTQGNAIADSALKYLDWGVEYTPYSGVNQGFAGNSGRKVYAQNKEEIQAWIQDGTIPSHQITTGFGQSNTTSVKRVHVMEAPIDTKRVILAGKLKKGNGADYQDLEVSRIDLWSSENLAWKQGVVAANYPLGLSALSDKDRSHSVTLNGGQSPITVGYDFSSPQLVGAMVLAVKSTYAAGNHEVTKIQVTVGGATIEVPPDYTAGAGGRFYEYYSSGTEKTLNRNNSVRTANDPEVRYWYYLLDPPESVSSIRLKLNGAVSSQIEELMVFEKNPINYITGDDLEAAHGPYEYRWFLDATVVGEKLQHDLSLADYNKQSVEGDLFFNADVSKSRKQSFTGQFSSGALLNIRKGNVVDGTTSVMGTFHAGDVCESWDIILGAQSTWNWVRQISAAVSQNKYAEGFADIQYAITNKTFTRKENVALISLSFKSQVSLEQIVVWEKGGSVSSDSVLEQEFVVLSGPNDFLLDALMGTDEGTLSLPTLPISTPFLETTEFGEQLPKAGNPLPYAPLGIDTPRTFTYKMSQQVEAREWYRSRKVNDKAVQESFPIEDMQTTAAIDGGGQENFVQSYVNEALILREAGFPVIVDRSTFTYGRDIYPEAGLAPPVKPFLPGYLGVNNKGYIDVSRGYSPFNPDKSAGVDAFGLLMGVLYEADVKVTDVWGTDPGEKFKRYASMSSNYAGSGGLDADGLPVFYSRVGNTLTDKSYTLTKEDLERCTILVPDISLIRRGDLLVGYIGGAEPDIGIVVGVPENLPQAYGEDARSLWDKVAVISVKRAFRMVTLGLWGTRGNTFGGFSSKPECYQIRRLLVSRTSPPPATSDNAISWEMVENVVSKVYRTYPSEAEAPSTYQAEDVPDKTLQQAAGKIKEHKVQLGGNSVVATYLKELPPSSSTEGYADRPIFDIPLLDYGKGRMIITQYTGWRALDLAKPTVSYHRAIDVVPNNVANNNILAPESGVFWFVHSDNANNAFNINLPNQSILNISPEYRDSEYGIITVLMTHAEKLRNDDIDKGRVYLFCHQGTADTVQKKYSIGEAEKEVKDEFSKHYTNIAFPEVVADSDPSGKAIPVKAGDWIGLMSSRGVGTGKHVHLEVFEWFPEKRDAPGVKYWERINPRTVFPHNWMGDQLGSDGAGTLMQYMTAQEQVNYFRKWGVTDAQP